jgi:hypothetical protein
MFKYIIVSEDGELTGTDDANLAAAINEAELGDYAYEASAISVTKMQVEEFMDDVD